MDGIAVRERRPVDIHLVPGDGYRGVFELPHGVRDGNDGRVVDDEISPYLLKRMSEIFAGHCRVDGEVRAQIGAVVGRRHRVLIFPGRSVPGAEGLGDPLGRAVEDGLGRDVEYRLLNAGRQARLFQCRRPCVPESIKDDTTIWGRLVRDLVNLIQIVHIPWCKQGEHLGDEAVILRPRRDVGIE